MKKTTMRNLLLLGLFGITFCSCSMYKYQNMYYLNMHRTTVKARPTKQISSYDYIDNNVKYFTENGYVMLGYDAIRHTYIGYQEAVNAGCWVGATVLLYKHQYVGTASGTAVVPFYRPGDSYSVNSKTSGTVSTYGSSSASVYGSGGYAYGTTSSSGYGSYNANTTMTITTPGSFSYYTVPYSNDYYDQWAVFYVKKYYRTEQNISLYQKADVLSKEIATVEKNVWFEIVSKNSTFIKINYKGLAGYISNYYSLK